MTCVERLETFGEDDGLSRSDLDLLSDGKNRITAIVRLVRPTPRTKSARSWIRWGF